MYCLKCHLFSTYQLIAHRLNKTDLTSTVKKLVAEEDNQGILEYILPDSYLAITADEASCDTLWFIKIIKFDYHGNGNEKVTDDMTFHLDIKRMLFRKVGTCNIYTYIQTSQTYTLFKKATFFTKKVLFIPLLILNLAREVFKYVT